MIRPSRPSTTVSALRRSFGHVRTYVRTNLAVGAVRSCFAKDPCCTGDDNGYPVWTIVRGVRSVSNGVRPVYPLGKATHSSIYYTSSCLRSVEQRSAVNAIKFVKHKKKEHGF